MMGWRLNVLGAAAMSCLVACSGDDDDDNGSDAAAEQPTAGQPAAVEDSAAPRYGVISSDYSATAISLLDANGHVFADNYINSGSTKTGLVTALSGDVELPTASGESGELVIIDRYKTDVITKIRLSDGQVLGQVKTHTPATQNTANAFTSNPHDYIRVDDTTAWVTRSQPNIDPAAAEIDLGDDLLRIDPQTLQRTEERIDLSSLRTEGTRINPDTQATESVELYVHPSRVARVGNVLIVGLGLSAYDFSAVGEGTVAVVDLQTRAVTGLAIEELKSCTSVDPIPGATDRVLVGCGGDYTNPGAAAGVAVVRVADGQASVERSWRYEEHADGPVLSGSFGALDEHTVVAASNNFEEGGADSVFGTLDLDTGAFTQLLSIPAGQGTFGTPYYDGDTKKLLVPDASADADQRPTSGVHVFSRTDSGFAEEPLVQVAVDTGMPVRSVYPL